MKVYKVVEKFISVNGEGPYAGELAVFIRFKGCNLACSYCDTKWANDADCKAEILTKEEIVDFVKQTGIHRVTLTGGEPLLQPGIMILVEELLMQEEVSVEIETNGSIDLEPVSKRKTNRISLTMDYKLPSSGMEVYMRKENLALLDQIDAVKFVAGSQKDLELVWTILKEYDLCNKTKVHISPVFGKIKPESIVDWMKDHKLNQVSLSLQMHKVIWGSEAKGV